MGRHYCLWLAAMFLACGFAFQPTAALAQEYVGQVRLVVVLRLTDAEFNELTPQHRAQLVQDGVLILDATRELQLPERALSAHWLEFPGLGFGRRRFATDWDGTVRLYPVNGVGPEHTATGIRVFDQMGAETPVAVIPEVTLVADGNLGNRPTPSILRVFARRQQSMGDVASSILSSGERVAAFAAPPPAAALSLSFASYASALGPGAQLLQPPLSCSLAPSGCLQAPTGCLDYDGPLGDQRKYKETAQCGLARWCNFFGSTCFRWSFLDNQRCFWEAAFPWGSATKSPSCYCKHRFRYCQEIDDWAFDLTPTAAVIGFGQSAILDLQNNTQSNSTCLQVVGPGSATLAVVTTGPRLRNSTRRCLPGKSYELDHWRTSKKDVVKCKGTHYPRVRVRFKAPTSRKAGCFQQYRVVAYNGLVRKESWIEVVDPDCDIPQGEAARDQLRNEMDRIGRQHAQLVTQCGRTSSRCDEACKPTPVTSWIDCQDGCEADYEKCTDEADTWRDDLISSVRRRYGL